MPMIKQPLIVIRSIVALSCKSMLSISGNIMRCYNQEGTLVTNLVPEHSDNIIININIYISFIDIKDITQIRMSDIYKPK